MMKLFLMEWVGKDLGFVEVVKKLKNEGHEIVYWTGPNLDKHINQQQFPRTIFHDHFDALNAVSPEALAGEEFLPASEELIKQCYGIESAVLTMMNKRFESMSVSERKNLYYDYLGYWHAVLKKFQPDAILFPVSPHTVYDFVVYSLAQQLKIKTILFMLTRIGDRMMVMNSFEEGNRLLREFSLEKSPSNFSLNDLSKDLQDYYKNQVGPKAKLVLPDIKAQLQLYAPIKLFQQKVRAVLRSLKDLTLLERFVGYLKKRFGENIQKEYRSVQVKPDFSKKFIYVALNYQPENTTSPLGGVFVDQLLMLKVLSASLPEDWHIYVKEHPVQWEPRGLSYFSYRHPGYYKAIAGLKNTCLVPIETDTYDLIDHCQAVATANGTAGWEAILRFKPSLVFGYAWYRYCRGVFAVNDTESCRRVLGLIESGFKIDRQDILNYLAVFDKATLRGHADTYFIENVKVSVAESTENYYLAISQELLRE